MTGPVTRDTVREFIFTIAAQAKAALNGKEKPGCLQMSRLHPTNEKLVPSRYKLDDVEPMIADAIVGAQAGHNIYIEGRTIREDTARGNRRGKLKDTAAVFALVIDSDADKQMGWKPDATTSPSMSVETSPGNFQYWFFLRDAVGADIGQQLGERIRKIVNCDRDTGNVVQPYRVAGTPNYPNKKKRDRGRAIVPTLLVEFNPEVLWAPELLEQAFPLPHKAHSSNNAAGTDTQPDECNISADTLKIIRDGVADGLRSDVFWNVVRTLKLCAFTLDGVVVLLEKYPNGIARKYIGRLRHEVERVYNKLDQGQPDAQTTAATPTPEILFDPWARYVVPTFPFNILPQLVQEFVGAQAAVIGCDPSALAMCTLGTFSGALHHDIALKMLRNGDWYASPRLWLLLVAPAAGKKTPMLKTATWPLVQHEAHVHDLYRHAMRDYKQAAAQDGNAGQMQEPQPPPLYVAWDTTVESLGELLARGDGKKGLLVSADEVSGWLGSMERYAARGGGRADRAFWLQAYDGGRYRVDRIKRGETVIPNLSVSVMGGIQPTRLAELQGLTNDGLLQRFIAIMVGPTKFRQDRPIEHETYSKLVRRMISANPTRLIMTDGALTVMDALHRHLYDLETASEGLATGFQTFIGKLPGVAGSLALNLHMAHHLANSPELAGSGVADAVREQTVEYVRQLVLDFILPHAYEFYCGAEATDGERLRRLASWILTARKDRVLASDLTSNIADFRGLTLPEVIDRVSPLVALGWLQPTDKSPTCRSWIVTPRVHIQLAERAQTEEARKAALARLMGSPRKSANST